MALPYPLVTHLIQEHRETEQALQDLSATLVSLGVDLPNSHAPSSLQDSSVWTKAQSQWNTLTEALYQHFVVEEAALFDLLSPYRTMMLMTVEHDDLLVLQQAFTQALEISVAAQQPQANLGAAFAAFEIRIKAHILEEERGIFPLAERFFEPEEYAKSQRLWEDCQRAFQLPSPPVLNRLPIQPVQILPVSQALPPTRDIFYQTLFTKEHSTVRTIAIRQGFKQALHWVGPHQWLVVVSGKLQLESQPAWHTTATPSTALIDAGHVIQIDSQCWFSLMAVEDAVVLVFSVWPHPHYIKSQN